MTTRSKISVQCEHCERPFHPWAHAVGKARFCSSKCCGAARTPGTEADRFWAKAVRSGGCLVWTGPGKGNGYGTTHFRGSVMSAHRAAYILSKGPIPEGMNVCHSCDNRACVNPDHLWLGTQSENLMDMVQKGRQVLSPMRGEGHPKAKLTATQAIEICRSPESPSVLARRYGVSRALIREVRLGNAWAHVTGRGRAA